MSKCEKGAAPRYKMLNGEKELVKSELYIRSGGKCEHPKGCEETNIDKLTIDHFTPQSIARIWGWTAEEVNDPLNLLLLCRIHHREKDLETPKIKEENLLEYAKFKRWAIEQRAEQKRQALALAEKLIA